MPPLTQREREDLDNLRALIGAITRFLEWLTTESGAVPRDMIVVFLPTYTIVVSVSETRSEHWTVLRTQKIRYGSGWITQA